MRLIAKALAAQRDGHTGLGLAIEALGARGVEAGEHAAISIVERQLLAGHIPRFDAVERRGAAQRASAETGAELGLRRRDLAALAGNRGVPDAGNAACGDVGSIGRRRGGCGRRNGCDIGRGAGSGRELRRSGGRRQLCRRRPFRPAPASMARASCSLKRIATTSSRPPAAQPGKQQSGRFSEKSFQTSVGADRHRAQIH